MNELERNLHTLAGDLEFPPAPDLARSVGRRLAGQRPGAAPRRLLPTLRPARALALALLLLALAAGTALAASPALRNRLLELLGLRGATVVRVNRPPRAAPVPPELGRPATLASAQRRARFRILLPPRRPDGVFFSGRATGGIVTLRFRARRLGETVPGRNLGVIVSEFRGDLEPELVGKVAGPDTRVQRLLVEGDPAIWLSGAAHAFFYLSPDGELREAPARLASNTLLVQHGRLLIRIEGNLSRARAIAIACSLR